MNEPKLSRGAQIVALLRKPGEATNTEPERHRMFLPSERYTIDFADDLKTWRQFDTSQDAPYFGVWVDMEARETLTYAEGDWTLVVCPTAETFRAELDDMHTFYGDPPPAFISIDTDTGQRTDYYDERPKSSEVVS